MIRATVIILAIAALLWSMQRDISTRCARNGIEVMTEIALKGERLVLVGDVLTLERPDGTRYPVRLK